MAKKRSAGEFNLSAAIRDVLTGDPKISAKDALTAVAEKYPSEKINKNSFNVAYYTGRQKLGIKSSGRGRKRGAKIVKRAAARPNLDWHALQVAAKFLSDVGGADAALEAIKQVQALQVK